MILLECVLYCWCFCHNICFCRCSIDRHAGKVIIMNANALLRPKTCTLLTNRRPLYKREAILQTKKNWLLSSSNAQFILLNSGWYSFIWFISFMLLLIILNDSFLHKNCHSELRSELHDVHVCPWNWNFATIFCFLWITMSFLMIKTFTRRYLSCNRKCF